MQKKMKSKNKPSFQAMDILLDKYFAQKLFSTNEIELFEEEKSKAELLAVFKELGYEIKL